MTKKVKVWDGAVRLFHWSLVLSFIGAWISADDFEKIHIKLGYLIIGLVCFRIIWGFVGSEYARFSQFVRGPSAVMAYLRDILKGREKRYLGHNPAGAAMIVVLLVGILGLCLTGWMYTTDQFWGVDWVEEAHELLAYGLLACVGCHLLGVFIASKRHGENLVVSMVTGKKDK
ncbi:MAG: cytochrome b/b6 domain-containing protein [Methylocystaceae bacterium]|nr:cytochrome b/b6 domain-containing protein [Methylocystaceae bacterium]